MKEKFENRVIAGTINIKMDDAKGTWVGDKAKIVSEIISICEEYRRGGFTLTLRQMYYQLVSRDIVPNHDKVYGKISAIKDDVVYSGLVDWDIFEDRGRVPIVSYFEHNIADALRRTVNSYGLDKQEGQPNHIEVWTEKDAISSILRRVTDGYTVRLVVNKGYTSSTAIYGAYERFCNAINEGKKIRILYFGDHDPSGIDMIRDIRERLMFMFTSGDQLAEAIGEEVLNEWWENAEYTVSDIAQLDGYEQYSNLISSENEDKYERGVDMWKKAQMQLYIEAHELFEVIPVGLTMEQITQYRPPHNPAKITDPRAKGYIKKYGAISWEVDALRPDVMINIVREAILRQLDEDAYNVVIARQSEEIEKITEIIEGLE